MTEVSEHPVWGAPQPAPHWSTGKTLAAVGIAAVLAAGGAAVIHAAGDSSGQAGSGFGGPPAGGPGDGPGFGARPGGPDSANLPTALHGEFVVSDSNGGFTTEFTQIGTVTELSGTSITARSDDGFTQTYLIDSATRQGRRPARTGDTATIRATTRDGTEPATATAISLTP